MAKITFEKGDLIANFKAGKFNVIAHQCNCQENFGAGIAKKLVIDFPEISNPNGEYPKKPQFGELRLFNTNFGVIANIYSQIHIGCPHTAITEKCILNEQGFKIYDSFDNRIIALKKCLKELNLMYDSNTILGIPLIASGLAKDFNKCKYGATDLQYFKDIILPIIRECITNFDVIINYL